MKTYMANPENIERKWYVVDAKGKTLGRLSSEIAKILRGKHKPIYTPHVDTGDHVIVINAELVELTGKKMDKKVYRHHTGYPGGLKEVSYRRVMETKPTMAIYEAVKNHDVAEAGRLMREHLETAFHNLLEQHKAKTAQQS